MKRVSDLNYNRAVMSVLVCLLSFTIKLNKYFYKFTFQLVYVCQKTFQFNLINSYKHTHDCLR